MTNTAARNEYKFGKHIMGKFLSLLGKTFDCGWIPTLIVPGNHDMILSEQDRDIHTILKWNKEEHLQEELARMEDFFEYANSKNCFREDRICDNRILEMAGLKIQCCLLNSAPFSTRQPDDKQVHFLPERVQNQLYRAETCDLKITVMHHSYEWCDWNTKTMLKKYIVNSDAVLFGHDHQAEGFTITDGKGQRTNIVMGGRFNLSANTQCSFNALIFDTEQPNIENFEFTWQFEGKEQPVFVEQKTNEIPRYRSRNKPTAKYLECLLMDKQKLAEKFTDYYVFPKLKPAGELFGDVEPDSIDVNAIFDALEKSKIIGITGPSGVGKTTLLKYLYNESTVRGFAPLFIEQRDYRDSRIKKMFRDMYELQYGGDEIDFEAYCQTDFCKRIVFVDNLDLIKSAKARDNLLEYIITQGGLLIYSTKEPIQQSLVDIVKERIQDSNSGSLEIALFYKETRDKLIERICNLEKFNQPDRIPEIVAALDYLVQSQPALFSLTPGALIQYIMFFIKEGSEDKGTKTLTLVFETNIRSAMIARAKGEATVYLAALEYIAHTMYFAEQTEILSISQAQEILSTYNKTYHAKVNAKIFIETCKDIQIFVEPQDSYDISFRDKNTFAYFVAKYISRCIERDPNELKDISYVISHICFGINDTIVLFLSYIRSNVRVILTMAAQAEALVKDYPELNFDANNLPFLTNTKDTVKSLPTAKEKKQATESTELIEQHQHEAVKFRGIFDYDEADVEKDKYRILRALKYVRLIGRALVDQYGSLTDEELKMMVGALYTVPQKIIYATLKPYQDHYDDIIAGLMNFVKEIDPENEISINEVQELLNSAAVNLALNIMNDIGYNASNRSTMIVLNEAELSNSNHKVQNLIMQENAGNSAAFIAKAVDLREEYENVPFIKYLIARIAHKHIIYTSGIDQRLTEKLVSGKVLSPGSKKAALVGQVGMKDKRK